MFGRIQIFLLFKNIGNIDFRYPDKFQYIRESLNYRSFIIFMIIRAQRNNPFDP